jgi:hypothetical protein
VNIIKDPIGTDDGINWRRRGYMLETVDVGAQHIESYEASVGSEAIARLRALASPLKGARILHLNATPYGGGVAEILRSEIPPDAADCR